MLHGEVPFPRILRPGTRQTRSPHDELLLDLVFNDSDPSLWMWHAVQLGNQFPVRLGVTSKPRPPSRFVREPFVLQLKRKINKLGNVFDGSLIWIHGSPHYLAASILQRLLSHPILPTPTFSQGTGRGLWKRDGPFLPASRPLHRRACLPATSGCFARLPHPATSAR